jgi:ABC-2 type transport system ATP-binding protein
MKRRLMIARALIHEPRLLILDEPTAGVDIELRRSMWEFLTEINESGTTIILTTHYLEEAEQLCRNIAIIDNGRIVENTSMKQLLSELDSQVYIVDSSNDLTGKFEQVRGSEHELAGVTYQLIDEHCVEVTIIAGVQLNSVFKIMDALDVQVIAMRNKSNRLEQLFISKLSENQ